MCIKCREKLLERYQQIGRWECSQQVMGEAKGGLEFIGTFSFCCMYTSILFEYFPKKNVAMHYFV